ncbi:hypothetical protein ACAW74_11015 [Fibrella sp. WM1]|uniref:hypothetical protein n=1 Tax=Fibrella musci TaxID=3242485 RepID=UPI003522317C
MRPIGLFFGGILLGLVASFSETMAQQAGQLAADEKRLVALRARVKEQDFEKRTRYSAQFDKAFVALLRANPQTLTYPFRQLSAKNDLRVVTSADGTFRIYSWDDELGGTMRSFTTAYQWRDGGQVVVNVPRIYKEEGDAGSFCSAIFTVDVGKRRYYLAVENSIFSTKDARQSIAVYRVDKNRLISTDALFRTQRKQFARIDVDFDFFSVVDRPERPLQLITYDAQQKIVAIPVVDDKGKVSNRRILYQLTGDHFQFIGIKAAKSK